MKRKTGKQGEGGHSDCRGNVLVGTLRIANSSNNRGRSDNTLALFLRRLPMKSVIGMAICFLMMSTGLSALLSLSADISYPQQRPCVFVLPKKSCFPICFV